MERYIPTKWESSLGRFILNIPMIALDSIGAGTGMFVRYNDVSGRLEFGPESAGYKIGVCNEGSGIETVTMTDCSLILGYLNPDYFLGGKVKLNKKRALDYIEEQLATKTTNSVDIKVRELTPKITITFPCDGDSVKHIDTYFGKCYNVPVGCYIWLVIKPGVENYWYPQGDNNGSFAAICDTIWSSYAVIGQYNNIGKMFSLIAMSLPTKTVNFGSMNVTDKKNTTDPGLSQLVIQNDGNCLLNITINGTALWSSAALPSDYFRFKIDNSTEPGSFTWASSLTSWTNVPASNLLAIVELIWSEATDTVEIDLLVEVPGDESPGNKSSTLTFESSLAE